MALDNKRGRRGAERKPKGNRTTKKTILIVTNGAQTEVTYFNSLKTFAGSDVSVKVKFINGEPETLLRSVSSPLGDATSFDQVWAVVDHDGKSRDSFVRDFVASAGGDQEWHAVVSRPSFEVWLIAHFEAVRNYQDQNQVKAHYRKFLAKGQGDKELPAKLDIGRYSVAGRQCCSPADQHTPLDAVPMGTGTSMPHLITALGL